MARMPPTEHLTYERTPQVGHSLIDEDGRSVLIRILPDRSTGRLSAWLFGSLGGMVFLFSVTQLLIGSINFYQAIPLLCTTFILFAAGLVMRYGGRSTRVMILGTPSGIEITSMGLAPRMIERTKIIRVFTRDAALSKQMLLGLRMTGGADVILGSGMPAEIQAMAKALHQVLNSNASSGESAHAG